jgi:peptidoglycan/LPS O-acetylase OafA/YrhL
LRHAKDRLQAFDLVRLIAVAYVITLTHIPDYLTQDRTGALNRVMTHLMLGCLVLVSGYVLTLRYPGLRDAKGIRSFLTRRLLRVYPLYVVALLGYVVYDRSLTPVNVAAHLLSLNLVLTPATGEPLRTIWFVSMIILYHFAYVGFARMRDSVMVIVAVLATLMLLVIHTRTGCTDERLALFLPLFAAGIVMARRQVLSRLRAVPVLFSAAVFVSCGIAQLVNVRLMTLAEALLGIVWMLSGALPVWAVTSWLIRNLGWGNWAGRLSYASFCAYLFHRHIYRILLLIRRPSDDGGTVLYLVLVGVPLAFLVGFYVQSGYDRLVSRLSLR